MNPANKCDLGQRAQPQRQTQSEAGETPRDWLTNMHTDSSARPCVNGVSGPYMLLQQTRMH